MKPAELGVDSRSGSTHGSFGDGAVQSRAPARNLGGTPFPHRADSGSRARPTRSRRRPGHVAGLGRASVWTSDELTAWDRRLPVERHLATRVSRKVGAVAA